jgi:hypothetical protein
LAEVEAMPPHPAENCRAAHHRAALFLPESLTTSSRTCQQSDQFRLEDSVGETTADAVETDHAPRKTAPDRGFAPGEVNL